VRKTGIAWIGLAVASTVLLTAPPAGASATQVLATWSMNQPAGAKVLQDSSGHGINGTIGAHVVSNGSVETFPYVPGGDGGLVDPQHLDLVSNAKLNPGTRDFAMTFRLKFTLALGNPMQKGQSGTPGGFFKVQLDDGGGKILCSFVSPTGNASVWSSMTINDGKWHVVTCTRTATQVSVTVDGVVAGKIAHATGNISNTWPLAIGGKSKCDQVKTFCDYFTGQIDSVQILTS
jgi:hypothetical protein